MAEFLKKIRPGSIVGFILCIVFGVVVCIWPGTVMIIACRIAGALLLACGIYNLIMGARNQNMAVRGFQITAGLVLCVVGVWILVAPGTFLKLIPVVIGLVLIYHGVKDIYISILVKTLVDWYDYGGYFGCPWSDPDPLRIPCTGNRYDLSWHRADL